jgi:group I intron endonuclease
MDIISYLCIMKKGIIYKYTSPSGKHYIGKTVNPKARKREHLCNSKTINNKFYCAVRKYGLDSFEYEVLFESILLSIDELNSVLNKKEKHFIKMFDSFNNGYNLTLGGDGQIGFKHSEKTKALYRQQRQSYSKETLEKMSNSAKGKSPSKETIEKIRLGNIGKGMSEANKKLVSQQKSKPIIQFDLQGNFIKEWKSATEAGKFYNTPHSNINRCCKTNKGTAKGFIWKYKTTE